MAPDLRPFLQFSTQLLQFLKLEPWLAPGTPRLPERLGARSETNG